MGPYVFSLLYSIISWLYLFRMKESPDLANRIIFKILPLGMLIGATMQYMKQRHTLAIKNVTFAPRIYTMVGGFLFHAMSSIYYEFQSLNYYGMICYAVALIVEIYGYSSSLDIFEDISNNELMLFGVLIAISTIVYFYVLPKLNLVNAILVLLFSTLDTLFVFVLTIHALRYPIALHYLGAFGAGLRYIADVLQTIQIWRIPFPHSALIILAIYYTAQLAVAGSVLLPITL